MNHDSESSSVKKKPFHYIYKTCYVLQNGFNLLSPRPPEDAGQTGTHAKCSVWLYDKKKKKKSECLEKKKKKKKIKQWRFRRLGFQAENKPQ